MTDTMAHAMPFAIGVVLSVLTALFLRGARFDRDRAVYPTLLIVIATYYVLFAVMGGSTAAIGLEAVALLAFTAVAVAGFAGNLWWVAAALAGHGLFDSVHSRLIANPGVPAWWPAWCLGYDVGFAACLAWLLSRRRLPSRPGA